MISASPKRRAPCVDLKTDALKDERFEVLGEIAGYNRFESIGRMYSLWAWCVDRGLKDAPDDCEGYAVVEAVVRRFLGADGVRAILADDCDELALGRRRDDGKIYLRGTSEYVAGRRARQQSAIAGGNARAADSQSNRSDDGRFVSQTTIVQPEPSREPADAPAADQRHPPSSSSSSSSSSGSAELSLARARKGARWVPGAEYVPDWPEHTGPLRDHTYAQVAKARAAVIAELGLVNELPMPAMITPASRPTGYQDLAERIREEGAMAPQTCNHVVEFATKRARDERSVEYLSDKLFGKNAWRFARNNTPSWRSRAGPRAGPIGPATPRNDHPTGEAIPFLDALEQTK